MLFIWSNSVMFYASIFFQYVALTVLFVLIIRKVFRLEKYVTIDNIELVNKLNAWLKFNSTTFIGV